MIANCQTETNGLQQTQLGFIPKDWSVAKLGDHAAFKTGPFGSTLHKSDYVDGGIPVINPMQIVDGKLVPTSTMAITEATARKLSEFRLRPGNVVIGRRGDMGRCAVVEADADGWLCGTGSIEIRPQLSLDSGFLQRQIASPLIINEIENTSVGTTMINLNQATLSNLCIPLPPTLAEQEAIAEALGDADAWIESLEQLVAKKRQIKQGAIQQLLPGKKRLPGFEGEWEVKRLGDVAHIKTGDRNNEDKIEEGLYPFFVRSAKVERINSYSHDCEAVLVPGEGGIGSIFHYVTGRFDVHQRVYAIRQFAVDIAGKFVYFYMLLYFGDSAMQNTVKATVDSLRLPTFQNFEIRFPPTTEEQYAIAEVLSDMDEDISATEAKLVKAQQIKQGMMQELLTGRVRLVKSEIPR